MKHIAIFAIIQFRAFFEGGEIIKHSNEKKEVNLVDYFILLFIIFVAFYMFNNTRLKVNSSSHTENGEEFPFISEIDYLKETSTLNLEEDSYYINEEQNYYIKITFNKEVYVSENAKVRVLFNNNTYIERDVSSGTYNHLLVEGDNTIHYEKELKVIDIEVINGYIKDEYNHELNTQVKEELIDLQKSLFVLNNKPALTASSEKSFYTSNVASIIIETNKNLVSSYCISEDYTCDYSDYVEYNQDIINYEFNSEETNQELCVFIKDKAGNTSDCSLVKFNYYSSPKFNFEVEEGNVVNNNSINISIEMKENEYLNLKKYCLYLDNEECNKKELAKIINEQIILDNVDSVQTIKFILFDDLNNSFEYEHKVVLDKTKPELDIKIINEDNISNHKDILINYKDNYALNELNEYAYYLSLSNEILTGSNWVNFTNNKAFRIRNVNDGDYYLWIKNIKDQAGNYYSSEDYILISKKLSFDNTKPLINIVCDDTEISESNLTKEFIITYSDYNEIKETILDSSSLVISSTVTLDYTINIKSTISNGWIVEVTFTKENLVSGYLSLTVLSNLVEDSAGNKNDAVASKLIKIK